MIVLFSSKDLSFSAFSTFRSLALKSIICPSDVSSFCGLFRLSTLFNLKPTFPPESIDSVVEEDMDESL